MSFENSQVSYIHLVSFPSCWLPPKHTKKLMVVGLEQLELEALVKDIQTLYPDLSFAVYFVPQFRSADLEHLDWLLINQHHMDAIWVQVTDYFSVAMAQVFRGNVFAHCQSHLPEIIKLVENCTLPQHSFVQFVGQVCQQEDKQA